LGHSQVIHNNMSAIQFVIPGLTRNPLFFRILAFVAMTAFATTDVAVDRESEGSATIREKKQKKRPGFRGAFTYPITGAWANLAALCRIKTLVISAATEAANMKGIATTQSQIDIKVVSKNGRRKGT
jgi:hypothetical protein